MALGIDHLEEIADLQIIKIRDHFKTDEVYFSRVKKEPLIYGCDTMVNHDDKPMVMRVTLRISYEELPK